MSSVLADVLADHRQGIEQVGARVTVSNELPTVRGDRTKLYQIFSNLVGNALKFKRPDSAPKITVTCEPSANPRRAVVVVADDGCGIPAERLESVFRPFQRGDQNKTEGSGIGLACVKRLLEKVGGEVRVESTVGSGSKFYVTLTLEPQVNAQPSASL